MSHGELPEPILRGIDASLPEVPPQLQALLAVPSDMISMCFCPDDRLPIGIICLQDSAAAAVQARYALHECIAHGRYYREVAEPSDETMAIYFERFYADDVALRLYTAGEHLASGIICMLRLSDDDLKPFRSRVSSLQAQVGRYLKKNEQGTCLRRATERLMNSEDWTRMIQYRGQWTHAQPPLVAGIGVLYERRLRWEAVEGGHQIDVGGGDAPKLTTAKLRKMVAKALGVFLRALSDCYLCYREILSPYGIRLIENGDGA